MSYISDLDGWEGGETYNLAAFKNDGLEFTSLCDGISKGFSQEVRAVFGCIFGRLRALVCLSDECCCAKYLYQRAWNCTQCCAFNVASMQVIVFTRANIRMGWRMARTAVVHDLDEGFVLDDSLKVMCELSVVSGSTVHKCRGRRFSFDAWPCLLS